MFGWFIGAGLAAVPARDDEMKSGPYPALEAAATYRPSDGFGVGVHARVSRVDATTFGFGTACDQSIEATSLVWDQQASMTTLDLGAAVELVHGPWLLQPRLGAHLASGHATTTFTVVDPVCGPSPPPVTDRVVPLALVTAGVLVSLDVWSPGPRDRVAIFVDAELAYPRQYDGRYAITQGWEPGQFYDAVTLGIAYRR